MLLVISTLIKVHKIMSITSIIQITVRSHKDPNKTTNIYPNTHPTKPPMPYQQNTNISRQKSFITFS